MDCLVGNERMAMSWVMMFLRPDKEHPLSIRFQSC